MTREREIESRMDRAAAKPGKDEITAYALFVWGLWLLCMILSAAQYWESAKIINRVSGGAKAMPLFAAWGLGGSIAVVLFSLCLTFYAAKRRTVPTWLLAMFFLVNSYASAWGVENLRTQLPWTFAEAITPDFLELIFAGSIIQGLFGMLLLLSLAVAFAQNGKRAEFGSENILALAACVCFGGAFVLQLQKSIVLIRTPAPSPAAQYDISAIGKSFVAQDFVISGSDDALGRIRALLKHPDRAVREKAYTEFLNNHLGSPGSLEVLAEYTRAEFARVGRALENTERSSGRSTRAD
ncbi:MAG TPA: hypothetical protein PLP17_13980 [Oligoflexia bacterium]|nr:hypothetical protein [Oligoflexia bacterium]